MFNNDITSVYNVRPSVHVLIQHISMISRARIVSISFYFILNITPLQSKNHSDKIYYVRGSFSIKKYNNVKLKMIFGKLTSCTLVNNLEIKIKNLHYILV